MISIVIISKDEVEIAETLSLVIDQAEAAPEGIEVIVVDASAGRLEDVAQRFPSVRWIDYTPPPGVRISIPHQRNVGVRSATGDLIVFIDAGCMPRVGWLTTLVGAIRSDGESVVAGLAVAPDGSADYYQLAVAHAKASGYLEEAPTITLAFLRIAFEAVGGFDEAFEYGSDIDFTWRLREHGFRIRSLPDAVVEHSWGPTRRQVKRAFRYGRARAQLYAKHSERLPGVWRTDPIVLAYPLFLLGLPLTVAFPAYPLLLLVPAWRARDMEPLNVIIDHLAYGCGVIAYCAQRARAS